MDNDLKINIDLINHHVIQGWFINTPSPEEDTLNLYIDGHYQGFSHANHERADVEAIHQQLHCGFSLDLDRFPNFQTLELKSGDQVLTSIKNNDFNPKIVPDTPYSQSRHAQLTTLKIDLRNPIEGDNWHPIEATGRWAGPALESTLTIPALSVGTYQLAVHIQNHFCDLAAMELELNNQPVHFSNTDFPSTVILHADIQITEALPCWFIRFQFSKIEMPDDNPTETRQLAIFLQMLTFTAK
jgi:hypothetical protein